MQWSARAAWSRPSGWEVGHDRRSPPPLPQPGVSLASEGADGQSPPRLLLLILLRSVLSVAMCRLRDTVPASLTKPSDLWASQMPPGPAQIPAGVPMVEKRVSGFRNAHFIGIKIRNNGDRG